MWVAWKFFFYEPKNNQLFFFNLIFKYKTSVFSSVYKY